MLCAYNRHYAGTAHKKHAIKCIYANIHGMVCNYEMLHRCPCDDETASLTFVGEDYFCESSIERPSSLAQFLTTFFFRECLWDGEGCADSSTCCSRIDHPYFIKDLDTPTSDDIDLRVCNGGPASQENFAIELIELYVQ